MKQNKITYNTFKKLLKKAREVFLDENGASKQKHQTDIEKYQELITKVIEFSISLMNFLKELNCGEK